MKIYKCLDLSSPNIRQKYLFYTSCCHFFFSSPSPRGTVLYIWNCVRKRLNLSYDPKVAAGWAVTLAFLLLPHWFKITAIVSLLRSSGLTWSWICIVRRHLKEVNEIAHRPKLQTIISIASAHPFASRFYETVITRLDLIILFGSSHYPQKITSLKSYLVLDCISNIIL